MPGETGVTVVTCSCAFFICTRGCGRIQRPAFPAPSDVQKAGCIQQNLARDMRRDRETVSAVIARSEATKQSTLPLPHYGLLRGACHRARIRATRWLAMTVRVVAV